MEEISKSADSQLSIRPATPEDDAFIFLLFCQVRKHTFASLPLPEEQLNSLLKIQFSAQQQSYHAQYPRANVEIIELNGEAVGQWIYAQTSDHHCLVDISLMEESRNRGIGTWAAKQAISSAQKSGLPLRAHVANDNPGALDLWLRCGFKVIGKDDAYTKLEFTP